jgi:hypothetical protein
MAHSHINSKFLNRPFNVCTWLQELIQIYA